MIRPESAALNNTAWPRASTEQRDPSITGNPNHRAARVRHASFSDAIERLAHVLELANRGPSSGLDALVQPKQVGGVVLALECFQPCVLPVSVCGLDRAGLGREVDIDPTGAKWPQG